MSGICDICITADTCEICRDGRKLCAAYERNSNYNRLFGTPEMAARTLSITAKCFEPATACRDCMYKSYCNTQCDYNALLELLRGDA